MAIGTDLESFLAQNAQAGRLAAGTNAVIAALAKAAIEVADLISLGALGDSGDLAAARGAQNVDGDAQKALDLLTNDIFVEALRAPPVACVASEEMEEPLLIDPRAPLAVAIDPLDGSSNIETNTSIGTIFSVLPFEPGGRAGIRDAFLRPGRAQVAAGFMIYGFQTSLVFTIGDGVRLFILDRQAGVFRLTVERITVPPSAGEFAINMSNYRHWEEPVRDYIDDCVAGVAGPRSKNFNMRWLASMVAEAYRILVRGGVYLYPRDSRAGYENGRLRLVYEANPIAFLMEQAGGAATDGICPILDVVPTTLHGRIPLVFGSADKVARVARYHTEPDFRAGSSPLFSERGLLWA